MTSTGKTLLPGRAGSAGLPVVLACMAATAWVSPALAIDYVESADLSNGASFQAAPFGSPVGTLASGANSVAGALAGTCVPGDCNGIDAGDTQDSFWFTVPDGHQLTAMTVSTSSVSGPTGFSATTITYKPNPASPQFVDGANPVIGTTFLNLGGATANLVASPLAAGNYSVSVYGQGASEAGPFSMNWSVALAVEPLASDVGTQLAQLAAAVNGVGPGTLFANTIAQAQAYYAAADVQSACAVMRFFDYEVRIVWRLSQFTRRSATWKITTAQMDDLLGQSGSIQIQLGCN